MKKTIIDIKVSNNDYYWKENDAYKIKNNLYLCPLNNHNTLVKLNIINNQITYIAIDCNFRRAPIKLYQYSKWILVDNSLLYSRLYPCNYIIKVNTVDDSVTKIKLPPKEMNTDYTWDNERWNCNRIHNKFIFFPPEKNECILRLDTQTDDILLIPLTGSYNELYKTSVQHTNYIYFFAQNYKKILKFDMRSNDMKLIKNKIELKYCASIDCCILAENDIYVCVEYIGIIKLNTNNDVISHVLDDNTLQAKSCLLYKNWLYFLPKYCNYILKVNTLDNKITKKIMFDDSTSIKYSIIIGKYLYFSSQQELYKINMLNDIKETIKTDTVFKKYIVIKGSGYNHIVYDYDRNQISKIYKMVVPVIHDRYVTSINTLEKTKDKLHVIFTTLTLFVKLMDKNFDLDMEFDLFPLFSE